jgi:hypothetical protein
MLCFYQFDMLYYLRFLCKKVAAIRPDDIHYYTDMAIVNKVCSLQQCLRTVIMNDMIKVPHRTGNIQRQVSLFTIIMIIEERRK